MSMALNSLLALVQELLLMPYTLLKCCLALCKCRLALAEIFRRLTLLLSGMEQLCQCASSLILLGDGLLH